MKITVKYHAQARQASGTSSEQVDLHPPVTIGRLLTLLSERHGESLRRLLLAADGTVCPAILLFVADKQVRADSTEPLKEGDTLELLPPIAGG
ncbi:MAG: MoaD family protein [Phycisphaerales bacterium]|jgi:MoaD family protein|nr:MoaD family protein [Phycisphaerales bacterium]